MCWIHRLSWYDEPGSDTLARLLDKAQAQKPNASKLYVPFITVMEIEYLLLRQHGRARTEQVLSILHAWPITIVESNKNWRHEAARLKSSTSLSTADAWIASLALLLDAQLVHKVPEYDSIDRLKVLKLPYKHKKH